MPKQVDHEQRRGEIAAAVSRLAATRGLQGVSFREVASEAGISVSLVQHYFGTKEELLIRTLDIRSAALGERILGRLAELGSDVDPLHRIRALASAFLPTDDESRTAMLLYHAFAAAALTDEALRSAEAFGNGRRLRAVIADELETARRRGQLATGIAPETEAWVALSMVLGLSLAVLLGEMSGDAAAAIVDAHLTHIEGQGGSSKTR
jgi:TetR/AcrR family transcriptional repressor of bet genes